MAFVISFFTSMAGISGAFLLLPFQMSALKFTSPAVSPTNMVYNIFAIPGGVYRYLREGRMLWPLTAIVVAGTLPGVIAGGFIRLSYFSDPGPFKLFVGAVLIYIGIRLLTDLLKNKRTIAPQPDTAVQSELWKAKTLHFSWRVYRFEFRNEVYHCSTYSIFILSLAVGIIGGIYGIGGGAIIAPFLVSIFGLPIYTIAGATLMGTFVTSVVGVIFYEIVAPLYETSEMAVSPDWALGALFGIGGMIGIYLGARMQRFVPARWLKLMMTVIILSVAIKYIVGFLS